MNKHISKNNSEIIIWTEEKDGKWFACTTDLDGANESEDDGPHANEQAAIDAMEYAIADVG